MDGRNEGKKDAWRYTNIVTVNDRITDGFYFVLYISGFSKISPVVIN